MLNKAIVELAPNTPPAILQKWSGLIAKNGIDSFDLKTAILSIQNWECSLSAKYSFGLELGMVALQRTPSLVAIARYAENETAIDLVIGHIANTVAFFNVGGNMGADQIEETAYLLFDLYRILTIDDIVLCLKWAKAGKFGKVYDRLDGQIILSWFEAYFAQRQAHIEQRSIDLHAKRMQEEKNGAWDSTSIIRFKAILIDIAAKQERNGIENQIKKESAAEAKKIAFELNKQEQQKRLLHE